jgi:hypothetical protein
MLTRESPVENHKNLRRDCFFQIICLADSSALLVSSTEYVNRGTFTSEKNCCVTILMEPQRASNKYLAVSSLYGVTRSSFAVYSV